MEYEDVVSERENPFPEQTILPAEPRSMPPELAGKHGSDLVRASIRRDISTQKNLGQLPRLRLSPV